MNLGYQDREVRAAQSVLLELVRVLGAYRGDIVLIGGWVPYYLIPGAGATHIGSTDIDLALNRRSIDLSGYASIKMLLEETGYTAGTQPFIFWRTVEIDGKEIDVQVDHLAGEYAGTGKGHRTQRIQDLNARKTRGSDLAFDLFVEVKLEGSLPGGALSAATVRIAGIVPFLVMKGMALEGRQKDKDAYDLHFCVEHYPGGLDALAREFEPHLGHGLVKEALAKIDAKFASVENEGPHAVATFEGIDHPEDRALRQRQAYERVHQLLSALGIR